MVETRVPAPNIAVEGAAPSAPDDRRCWVVTMHPVETDAGGPAGRDRSDGRRRHRAAPQGRAAVSRSRQHGRGRRGLRAGPDDHVREPRGGRDPRLDGRRASAASHWTSSFRCERSHCPGLCHPQGAGRRRTGQASGRHALHAQGRVRSSRSPTPPHRCPPAVSVTGCVTVFRDVTEEKAADLRVQRELEALSWLGRIRDALTEDRFVLYAQPIVALERRDRRRGAAAPDAPAVRRDRRARRVPAGRRALRAHRRHRPLGDRPGRPTGPPGSRRRREPLGPVAQRPDAAAVHRLRSSRRRAPTRRTSSSRSPRPR